MCSARPTGGRLADRVDGAPRAVREEPPRLHARALTHIIVQQPSRGQLSRLRSTGRSKAAGHVQRCRPHPAGPFLLPAFPCFDGAGSASRGRLFRMIFSSSLCPVSAPRTPRAGTAVGGSALLGGRATRCLRWRAAPPQRAAPSRSLCSFLPPPRRATESTTPGRGKPRARVAGWVQCQ